MFERFDSECTASTPSSAGTERGDRLTAGELGVALVGRDHDAGARAHATAPATSRPAPPAAVGLPGSFVQSSRARPASSSLIAEVEVPLGVERHRHRAQPRELGAHRVRRDTRSPGTARCRGPDRAMPRKRGSDATISFVPMHASTWSGAHRRRRAARDPVGRRGSRRSADRSWPGTARRPARPRRARRGRRRAPGRPGCRSSSRRRRRAPRRRAGGTRRAGRAGRAAARSRPAPPLVTIGRDYRR